MFRTDFEVGKKKINSQEEMEKYAASVRAVDRRIGAFLEFDPQKYFSAETEPSLPLAQIPIAVKDNIAVKDFRLTCGSKMLADFVSPYTATAVERIMQAGGWVVGKTNLDEFGMGSSTDNSALQQTHNPWDTSRVAGGSSGGSAAAVAAGLVPAALGSDTGGSIRQPASFCGIYGLKPSYGAVSRYGLVAYASSLEGIGVLSGSLDLTRRIFDVMRGPDEYDQTSQEIAAAGSEARVIGVLKQTEGLDPSVAEGYRRSISDLQSLGYEIRELDLSTLDYVIPAYYTIASAEAGANLARYVGVRYGYQNPEAEDPEELMEASRDEGFGPEVKMRILLGSYVLRSGFQEQYYIRAQKIRTAIRRELDRAFQSVDLMMLPAFPTQAFVHGESRLDQFQQKLADRFTATANLAGIPALAFPVGQENGLPLGMQFLAPMHAEERLFAAARKFQEVYRPQIPAPLGAGSGSGAGGMEGAHSRATDSEQKGGLK